VREIEFRGKRNDNGEWIFGNLVYMHKTTGGWTTGIHIQIPCGDGYRAFGSVNVDPETVGQYIGLKDMNEKKIYEGDIIKITFDTNFSEKPFYIGQVEFKSEEGYPAFDLSPWIDCEMNALSWLASNSDPSVLCYEVIGSIHKNPELIK
jgi:uncharacterized phage protein (TIGR01671 family)